MMRRPLSCLLALVLCGATPGLAQQTAPEGPSAVEGLQRGSVVSPILTINSDRVYFESAYGKRVSAQIKEGVTALEAENRRVEAELEAEELQLTKRRGTLSAEAFRALADTFDAKVQRIRAEQDTKLRALDERQVRERDQFLQAAAPVLEQLMRESGAAVILERRLVWVSVTAVDITDEAIALLDETLGEGTAPPQP